MAILKKNELQNITKEQINSKLDDLRKELLKVNAQRAMGTAPENPGRIKELRRTIARLITKSKEVKTKK